MFDSEAISRQQALEIIHREIPHLSNEELEKQLSALARTRVSILKKFVRYVVE